MVNGFKPEFVCKEPVLVYKFVIVVAVACTFAVVMGYALFVQQPCLPEDVANMLLFFASDESRAITGQTIVTDFGSTL